MTDDLANVIVDWAKFNGIDIESVNSNSLEYEIVIDSDLEDFPMDLLSAIGDDYLILFTKTHPNVIVLRPSNEESRSFKLGKDFEKWENYGKGFTYATWEGEP
jgi:hypothetical protein